MAAAYHVTRRGSSWAIRRSGSRRSLRTGLDRDEAWQEARRLARAKGVDAFLHSHDGRIETRAPYSGDNTCSP